MSHKRFAHHLPHVRQRALELLAAGKSLKAVERATGINRGTLSKIRHGAPYAVKGDVMDLVFGDRPKGRCPICGVKVFLPCLACELTGGNHG